MTEHTQCVHLVCELYLCILVDVEYDLYSMEVNIYCNCTLASDIIDKTDFISPMAETDIDYLFFLFFFLSTAVSEI